MTMRMVGWRRPSWEILQRKLRIEDFGLEKKVSNIKMIALIQMGKRKCSRLLGQGFAQLAGECYVQTTEQIKDESLGVEEESVEREVGNFDSNGEGWIAHLENPSENLKYG